MDSFFWDYCYYPPIKIAWGPDLLNLIREAVTRLPVTVIAPVSVSLTRRRLYPVSTGHESRQRHRGLGGRNFR